MWTASEGKTSTGTPRWSFYKADRRVTCYHFYLWDADFSVFVQRWLHRLPLPFTTRDHDAGYWWETSMQQMEISRIIVFDAPRHARGFFEALVADNLDIGGQCRGRGTGGMLGL